jgi:hypothetical protein
LNLKIFFTLGFGLGAELDAMILRKRHWRRVYFNRRCGHLVGAYDYFLLRISSVLFFSGSAATKSVPERPDEHVRAKHREGLRLGDNEAM